MAEDKNKFDQPEPAGNADSRPPGRRDLNQRERRSGKTDKSIGSGGADKENLSNSEAAGREFRYTPGVKQTDDPVGFGYRPSSKKPHKRGLSGWNRRRKLLTGLGGAGVVVAALVAFLLSVLPFELIHLKHVITDDIGGTQARTYQLGREKMYSSMFFFDKGQYSGNKVGGIRRLMGENVKTKKLYNAMKKNGYEIKFDARGRVTALNHIDENGKVIESFKSENTLLRAWSIKDPQALPNILREIYPDKSDFWYNRATIQMNRRLGLTRTNWLREQFAEKSGLNAANRKIGAVEERFVAALRQKLFGTSEGDPLAKPGTAEKEKDKDAQKAADDEVNSKSSRFQKFASAASSLKQKLLGDSSFNPTSAADSALAASGGNVEDAIRKSVSSGALAKDVGGSVLSSLNLLNIPQKACTLNGDLNAVEMGARTLQAAQLIKFTYSIANIADAAQDGKSVDPDQVNAMMGYLNSKDSKGNSMFNSSGYRYWTDPKSRASAFNGADADERDKYSVGGGYVGTLQAIRSTINHYIKGGSACHGLHNPFVTVAGFVAGGVAAFFTAGTSVVVSTAANITTSMFFSFANSMIVGRLVPMVAGTVVNGMETGTAVGNAFISGGEALANTVGANAGMRPLSAKEFQVAEASYQADQKAEAAHSSLASRLFSPEMDHSLTTVAATNLHDFSLSKVASLPSSLLHFVSNFGGLFNKPVLAAGNDCPDRDIQAAGVAATPFCNIIVGIPDSVLNDPAYAPDKLDDLINKDGNNVDDFGNPVPGSDYAKYIHQCTAGEENDKTSGGGLDLIHTHPDDGNDYKVDTKTCSNDLFNLYRFYMTIAQSENDALTDNLPQDGDPASGAAGSNDQASSPTGDVYSDSSSTACAAGTTDLGVQDGYSDGHLVKIRVCGLPNMASSSEESQPGSPYYVTGANGKAIVNAAVSKQFFDLASAANAVGINIAASSTFRTMEHQQELCNGNAACRSGSYGAVAKPGTSNHQMGLAVDFNDIYQSVGGNTGACNPKETSPSPTYRWLVVNAARYGLKQYCAEAWHWSPTGN